MPQTMGSRENGSLSSITNAGESAQSTVDINSDSKKVKVQHQDDIVEENRLALYKVHQGYCELLLSASSFTFLIFSS